jgi:CRISPR/Cas system-associated exonuclease Cas4 (RecB family)
MHYLLIAVIFGVLVLWMNLSRKSKHAGIKGWVETADLDGKGKQVYRNKEARISSKPDVVERNRVIEYKSAAIDGRVRWSDLMQLALQIKTTGKPEGELRYANKSFHYTQDDPELKAATKYALKIVERMRWHLASGMAPKATPTPRRCEKCTFSRQCPEAIRKDLNH